MTLQWYISWRVSASTVSRLNWDLEVFFVKGGKPQYPEKNPWSKLPTSIKTLWQPWLFVFLTVYGPHGRVVFHFQRSQCVLSHVCCVGVLGDIFQFGYQVFELSWFSNFYHWRWFVSRVCQWGERYCSKR